MMDTVRNCGNNDGAGSHYMTCYFHVSEVIINENSNVSKLDYGRDFAFASSWLNNKDERIIIGWMSNIVYAPQLPTVLYKNYKSIPRKLALKTNKDNELVLYSSVVNQFDSLKTRDTSIDSLKIDGKKLLENKFQECDGAFSVEFSFQSSQQKQVGVMLSNKNNENVNVLFDLEIGQLLFDRNKSGIVDFSSLFTMENIIPINKSDKYKVNIYSDKSSIEVFINDGETVLTNLVFPTESYTDLTFYNEGKALIIEDIKIREFSASIYQLSFEWMNWLDNSGDR